MDFRTAPAIGSRVRGACRLRSTVAVASIVCGATIAGAEGNRIPGVYDPAKQTFRLYPIPLAPAAASPKIYTGTLKITVKLYVSAPAGTTISGNADASAHDYAGGFDASASTQITANGKTATMNFTIPYATRLGDPTNKITVYVSVNASYKNSKGNGMHPSGIGTTNIALPKDGAATNVTVYVGV